MTIWPFCVLVYRCHEVLPCISVLIWLQTERKIWEEIWSRCNWQGRGRRETLSAEWLLDDLWDQRWHRSMYHARSHGRWAIFCVARCSQTSFCFFNPFEIRGHYSATSNNVKLVHWPLMSGLLHLVQRGDDWAGPQPALVPPRCTKCNSPLINGNDV